MTALYPPVSPLTAAHRKEVEAWLAVRPAAHVHQLNRLQQGSLEVDRRGTWICARSPGGRLRAVLYSRWSADGGPALATVPSGEPAACELLGQRILRMGGTRMLVGDRAACDAFWRGMRKPWFRIAYDQRLYTCRSTTGGPMLEVEPASEADVEDLIPMHTAMLQEDLGVEPGTIDRFAQWAQLQRSVATGRMLVVRGGTIDQPLRFCIDIGEPADHGAQVGGTFVPPAFRGKGVATAAMRGVCAWLFREYATPIVTLHVHESNQPAVRCYERAGFVAEDPFRLMTR